MAQTHIIEGTRDEVQEQLQSFPREQRFRLMPLPLKPKPKLKPTPSYVQPSGQDGEEGKQKQAPRQLTGMGRFANILPTSEEFMRHKQEEIDLEERVFGK